MNEFTLPMNLNAWRVYDHAISVSHKEWQGWHITRNAFTVRIKSRARFTSDETDFVAVHTLKGHEFSSEMVTMETLFRAVADAAWQQTEPSAHLACVARVWTLKIHEKSIYNTIKSGTNKSSVILSKYYCLLIK